VPGGCRRYQGADATPRESFIASKPGIKTWKFRRMELQEIRLGPF
jgi:hypothetical protein